jgi:hypothetical protein
VEHFPHLQERKNTDGSHVLRSCKPGAMPCHALRPEHTFSVDSVRACVLCVCEGGSIVCVFTGSVVEACSDCVCFLWACALVKGYSVCLRTPQECLRRPAPVIASERV